MLRKEETFRASTVCLLFLTHKRSALTSWDTSGQKISKRASLKNPASLKMPLITLFIRTKPFLIYISQRSIRKLVSCYTDRSRFAMLNVLVNHWSPRAWWATAVGTVQGARELANGMLTMPLVQLMIISSQFQCSALPSLKLTEGCLIIFWRSGTPCLTGWRRR